MKYCFGIDIGGTTVKCGLFTSEGLVMDKWEVPTDKADCGKNILRDIAVAAVAKLKAGNLLAEDITGIGVGVPGPVEMQSIVKGCVNLGWGEYNVKEELEKEFESLIGSKFAVTVENDANVAALGELWQGGGKGYKSLVMVTLGTGVGGGIILNGRILSGANGAAGEIGHMPVLYDEPDSCNCGKRGCLEQIASATGIVRHARRCMARINMISGLRDIPEDKLTAKDVFDAFVNKDELAELIVNEVCDYLATALAHITCVVDPEVIVIGGGVSKAGSILTDTVSKYYKEKAFGACKNTPIALATLGNDAGIYGAAGLALQ